jgi:WXG100 family type VII secretion target
MTAPSVRADYEQLKQIGRQFGEQADLSAQTLAALRQQMDVLQGGDWLGIGARAFYSEMSQSVLPTMNRLAKALQSAAQVTRQISGEVKTAEDAAAACFRLLGAGGSAAGLAGTLAGVGAAAGGTASAHKKGLLDRALDSLGGGLGIIGFGGLGAPLDALGKKLGIGAIATDITRGFIDEGADMLGGIWHAANHPIATLEGIGHAVTHPGDLWDALKKPYVEAWESGHPGQAIGRGILAVGSMLVGAGEAGAAGKAAAVAGRAGELAEGAAAAGRAGELAEAARLAGRASELADEAAAAGRVGDTAEAARAASEAAEIDAALDATFQGGRNEGAFETAARLRRGNLGERLATDALAADGHEILSYKPSILGTNQGGIDMVTMKDGVVYFVDNKALTRSGNVSSVSALTTNFANNQAAVLTELRTAISTAGSAQEASVLQSAVDAIEAGNFKRVVTNANMTTNDAILSGVTQNLADQGIEFIDVFQPLGAR